MTDIMFYGSFTKGTKSGGFDFRGNNRGFYSTMADAFEFKRREGDQLGSWRQDAASLAAAQSSTTAVYHTKIQDLQVSVFDGVLGYVVGNADARS